MLLIFCVKMCELFYIVYPKIGIDVIKPLSSQMQGNVVRCSIVVAKNTVIFHAQDDKIFETCPRRYVRGIVGRFRHGNMCTRAIM